VLAVIARSIQKSVASSQGTDYLPPFTDTDF